MRNNIHELERPGSLNRVSLPRTITDAVAACRSLGQKYLWVDRLSIVQDEPLHIKAVQLDQMQAIYRQAVFTIVALAGDGATSGLPGVTQPRTAVQKRLTLYDVELIESTPSLYTCMARSIWHTRGWTFQESAASMSLLYFTEFGVYFRSRGSNTSRVLAEGPAIPDLDYIEGMDNYSYACYVVLYMARCLTYPVDILRAFAGVLHGFHGPHTVFGMPWRAFDRAILWEATDFLGERRSAADGEIFPSWSWTSATGPVYFHDVSPRGCSVAFWAMVRPSDGPAPTLSIAEPCEGDESVFEGDERGLSTQMAAALAWRNGCINARVPEYLRGDDLSRPPRHLWERWPDHPTYWRAAFSQYDISRTFSNAHVELAREPGRIMVHTQVARLRLFHLGERDAWPGCNQFLIRSKDGMIAGSIYLAEHIANEYKEDEERDVEFIALSTCRFPESHPAFTLSSALVDEHFDHIPLPELYGCGCSRSSEPHSPAARHITACPRHVQFSTPVPFQPRPLPVGGRKRTPSERVSAYSKFLAEVSYTDSKGDLLHPWDDVPGLSVLLVRPSEAGEGDVHCRLGIGRIGLKRWADAGPEFRTIVLE